MAKVSNLKITQQAGSETTLLAQWDFNSTQKITTSTGAVRVGDYVSIKSGATWYNGASIPSWVFSSGPWRVDEVNGTRAVLGRNQSGTNNIQSPINVNNLTGGSGGSTTTTTVDTLDHYTYTWFYQTGDGIWYEDTHADTSGNETRDGYCTYSPPDNWTFINIHVIPVSKTRKVNGKDTSYWSGELAIAGIYKSNTLPEVPPSPDVEMNKFELTATVDNISDARSDEIQFQVYNGTTLFTSGTATVRAAMASFKCTVNAGGSYRVRARSANIVSGSSTARLYSDWTDFTSPLDTIPTAPSAITTIRGASSTSIYLAWASVNGADTYEIEYTTNSNYFDSSSEVTSIAGIEVTHYTVTGLESGDEYFFRVRAANDQGESGWSGIKSVVIGKAPAAPTTWSSATTVIVGDSLNLYWVHNAQDGSKETYAEVETTINGTKTTHTIENPTADDDEAEEKTKYYTIDTSTLTEGAQIKWRVRTAGITKQYGDWSIMRTVDVYARPTLSLSLTNQNGDTITSLTSFPMFIKGLAGPKTQEPIGYHVSIIADEGYQTVDSVGRTKVVTAGDEVYSQYIDTNDALLVELSASNIDLENGVSYTVLVRVSMNSGLTADAEQTFTVAWSDTEYPLDAQIAFDSESYVAYVTPYSRDVDTGELNAGLSLAVYRREFDGTFTEIVSGLDSSKTTVVTDPHPALDYARYRIVATENSTGAVSYYDPPGYPVGDDVPVIIQWNEEWTDFEVTSTAVRSQPAWAGSMLKLPYNIDVSDNNAPDVALVNYIGRTYPVSYYGTSIDSTSNWSVEIPATDIDTLYALRRLAIWQGDCYVREPSGSGYWANVNVSFSKTHNELTIPVTFDITRVEGGM